MCISACVCMYIHTHMCSVYQHTCSHTHRIRGVISKYLTSAVLYRLQIRTDAGRSEMCVCMCVRIEEVWWVVQHAVNMITFGVTGGGRG